MAKIFTKIDQEYAKREFPGFYNEVISYTHLVDHDKDHAICGIALSGSAMVMDGVVTCPTCVQRIKAVKKLRKGFDF